MRTEKEMYDLIINTAKSDDRIRAVIMNGSRTNPNVPKDIFQDYDIVYMVTETESFIRDKDWIKVFGKMLIMQLPDENDNIVGKSTRFDRCYGYLMQFADGTRIDLHIKTQDLAVKEMESDKLSIVLLDKDNVLPKIPAPTDKNYWIKKPNQDIFSECCNEYWWTSLYIAKGLWRDEILYSMDILNFYVRPKLFKMISWYAGIHTGFSCSIGKCGKYLNKFLPEDIWERYLKTFPDASTESVWNSFSIMNELFEEMEHKVADILGFSYNHDEAENCMAFAKHIRQLPKDAKEIY